MGVIKRFDREEFVLLNSQHVIGRNAEIVHLYVSDPDISKQHATLFWKNRRWYLGEHSTNGSMINGKYFREAIIPLKLGDVIQFGKETHTKWTLVDFSPPTSYLKAAQNHNLVLSLVKKQGIPNPDHPDISFHYLGDTRWKAEVPGKIIDLTMGTPIKFKQLEEEEWIFVANDFLDDTVDYKQIILNSSFNVYLSEDEERIGIKINGPDWEVDLGDRAHHYLLMALIRKRGEDMEAEKVFEDQGWVGMEELTRELSLELRKEIDAYYVNLQIFRLRKQLLGIKPHGQLFSDIIERRRGELRFAHPCFSLMKAGVVQYEMTNAQDPQYIESENRNSSSPGGIGTANNT